MYPLGVLFGLGFDTSSEIALLGISAISASQGTSFWLILLFPVLFTAGMCLLDTLDGALMMSLYTSTRLAKDGIAVLYYQSVLTGVTVLVAIVIGVIQLLNLVLNVAEPEGKFWEGVGVAGDHYDIIGASFSLTFAPANHLGHEKMPCMQGFLSVWLTKASSSLQAAPSVAPLSFSAFSASYCTAHGGGESTERERRSGATSRSQSPRNWTRWTMASRSSLRNTAPRKCLLRQKGERATICQRKRLRL